MSATTPSSGLNPSLSTAVRGFMVIVVIALSLGSTLVVYPSLFVPYWIWPIPPFNQRFLGAIYVGVMSTSIILLLVNRWAPGRLVLSAGLVFTIFVSTASVLNYDRFAYEWWPTYSWWGLYVGSVFVNAYFLWRNRSLPTVNPTPAVGAWRGLLLTEAAGLGLYGLLLFSLPSVFGPQWPWPLDRFHAQLYTGIFLANAAGALLLTRAAAPVDWLTLGAGQAVLSLLAIVGMIVVDAQVHRIDWKAPATWLWIGAFAAVGVAGLAMILRAFKSWRPIATA